MIETNRRVRPAGLESDGFIAGISALAEGLARKYRKLTRRTLRVESGVGLSVLRCQSQTRALAQAHAATTSLTRESGQLRAFWTSSIVKANCGHWDHLSGAAERRSQMFGVSVIGGLLLVGLCVSRVKASRGAKKSVQTLFDDKK